MCIRDRRWVVPPEIGARNLGAIQAARPANVQTEVLAYGRLALAYSARCFTARHFNLQKDVCGFRCIEFPEGLPLRTREGASFLRLNGTQTQSARIHNLMREVPQLAAMGVDVLRISAPGPRPDEVVLAWRDLLDGVASAQACESRCAATADEPACNGFWTGQAGLAPLAAPAP